jgi:biotin operon repressor
MKMLSIPEVAVELRVSEKTIWRELQGTPPAMSSTKIRGNVRVSRETVNRYIALRTTQGQC